MVIVYQGRFLAEGFRLLGHEVLPICFTNEASANEQIEAVCAAPDLVVLELAGGSALPLDLYACRHRIAAYYIDSCINEFWLEELSMVMDDVFVDQRSSVRTLASHGILAVWLPLCVSESDFRDPEQAKDYEITFIGRVDAHRTKRNNLLKYVSRHYPLHHIEGVSRGEMQDIFARSKIVLNENLFSGLTLRVLHGLAAKAVVLTEAGGDGVDHYFTHDKQLVCYSPDTLLSRIGAILKNYEEYEAIARHGHKVCRGGHTSKVRAKELLDHIKANTARTARRHILQRQCAEANAKYLLRLRFGGSFKESMLLLNTVNQDQGNLGAKAAYLLGNAQARMNKPEKARHFYTLAAEKGCTFYAQSKLALICLLENKHQEAKIALVAALTALPEKVAFFRAELDALPGTDIQPQDIFFILAKAYAALGHIFQAGFFKQITDNYPDTALELALLAWKKSPTSYVLDFLLEHAARCGVEGELLPELCFAIEHGVATDRQILHTAELAESYYDKDLAHGILCAMRKSQK